MLYFSICYKFDHGSIRIGKINCNLTSFLLFALVKKIYILSSKEGKLGIKKSFQPIPHQLFISSYHTSEMSKKAFVLFIWKQNFCSFVTILFRWDKCSFNGRENPGERGESTGRTPNNTAQHMYMEHTVDKGVQSPELPEMKCDVFVTGHANRCANALRRATIPFRLRGRPDHWEFEISRVLMIHVVYVSHNTACVS